MKKDKTIARVHCHKCIFSIDNCEFQTTLCTCAVLNQLNLPRQSSIHFYSTNGLLRHSIVLVFFIHESWVLLKKGSIRRSQRNRNLDLNFFCYWKIVEFFSIELTTKVSKSSNLFESIVKLFMCIKLFEISCRNRIKRSEGYNPGLAIGVLFMIHYYLISCS